MSNPLIILHRRNKIENLKDLPNNAWIEIDIDIKDGEAIISHDALKKGEVPLSLEAFLPQALSKGVKGFIADCKRENAYRLVTPLFRRHGVDNFFYLNEGEVQSDIAMCEDEMHPTALRIWRFRAAADALHYVKDAKNKNGPAPSWVWLDTYERGIADDIRLAYLALDGKEASKLKDNDIRICLCSPELYSHNYAKTYSEAELDVLKTGVSLFRLRIIESGIGLDAVCTKFPELWS